jgi:carbonic anhydrase
MKIRNLLLSAFLGGVICTSIIYALYTGVILPVKPPAAEPKGVAIQLEPAAAQPAVVDVQTIPGVAQPDTTAPGPVAETSLAPPKNIDTARDKGGVTEHDVITAKHLRERSVLTPAEALQNLKDGNRRFVEDQLQKAAGKERLIELAKGQKPIAAVIACADSRVSPELIFNLGLGELFVLRVAGNVAVEAYALAGSAEYAVAHLNVPLIVVIGHETCGAVKASLKGDPAPGNLGKLLKAVQVGNNLNLVAAVRNNVIFQADQLLLESEMIRDFVISERIIVVPAVYSLNTGEVTFMDPVVWEKG